MRNQKQELKSLSERMRLALEREHNSYSVAEPHIVSEFRRETLRFNEQRGEN
jgi:hypothetical protein